MSTVISTPPMTTEEMLALPEDGVDRELIRGNCGRSPRPRSRHSRAETELAPSWRPGAGPARAARRGRLREAGFRLSRDPDSTVGIDVAYVSAEVAAREPDAAYFEGPPVLAVEILSPSDTLEDIDEKVELYLEMGVAIVWVVHPRFRTVTVYRPGADPVMFSGTQELTAEPHLPGFRVQVDRLFGL